MLGNLTIADYFMSDCNTIILVLSLAFIAVSPLLVIIGLILLSFSKPYIPVFYTI